MRAGEFVRVVLAFAVLVVLHFTLRPLLGWAIAPDFLLLAVLVVAVRVRPGTAALLGLCLGLAADAIGTDPFGAAAVAMTIVAFGASWLQAAVFADDPLVNATLFFVGTWTFDAVFLFVTRAGGSPLARPLLVLAPMRAAVTALFGVVTLMVLRPVLRPPAR